MLINFFIVLYIGELIHLGIIENFDIFVSKLKITIFRMDIKIEAGFYSSQLVLYLVDYLNMPLTIIKYKIVTKTALKPDTFKDYIKFLFDNSDE